MDTVALQTKAELEKAKALAEAGVGFFLHFSALLLTYFKKWEKLLKANPPESPKKTTSVQPQAGSFWTSEVVSGFL